MCARRHAYPEAAERGCDGWDSPAIDVESPEVEPPTRQAHGLFPRSLDHDDEVPRFVEQCARARRAIIEQRRPFARGDGCEIGLRAPGQVLVAHGGVLEAGIQRSALELMLEARDARSIQHAELPER